MPDKDMIQSVKCGCGATEYNGMMHWRDGHQYCRHCMNKIWNEDRLRAGLDFRENFKNYYPFYDDGKDYSNGR